MTPLLLHAPFVHAAGSDLAAEAEHHPNPDHIDHVWLSMDTGAPRRLRIAVNTLSRRNRDAGFDGRIRLGIVRKPAGLSPPRGIEPTTGLDYAEIEAKENVFYETLDRAAMETALLSAAHRAILLEAWGVPYRHRQIFGLHQIHSRRASCAVAEDLRGQDGALRFHFPGEEGSALWLFKFCGQP